MLDRALLAAAVLASMAGCRAANPESAPPAVEAPARPAYPELDPDVLGALELTMLRPARALLLDYEDLPADIRAAVEDAELAVGGDITRFPLAEATMRPEGGHVEVDAQYLVNRGEQFILVAAARVLGSSYVARAHAVAEAHRQRCVLARLDRQPAPRLSLAPNDPDHLFGVIGGLFADEDPAVAEAIGVEQILIQDAYFSFVLLHELGHVAGEDAGEDSIARERAADDFAFTYLHAAGYRMDDLEAALRSESVAQDLARLAGYESSPSHPLWSDRLTALRQFMAGHPPVGEYVQFSGWVDDPASGATPRLVRVAFELPRDAGRRPELVVVRVGPRMNPLFIDGLLVAVDGDLRLRFRRGDAPDEIDEIDEIDLLAAPGHRVAALWGVSREHVLVGQRQLVLRAGPNTSALLRKLLPERRIRDTERARLEALETVAASAEDRESLRARLEQDRARFVELLAADLDGRLSPAAREAEVQAQRAETQALARELLGEEGFAVYEQELRR